MTLQEKYDGIIDSIEMMIDAGESNIPDALSRESGWNLRLIGDAFQFIADMTLAQYIRQRRLVNALYKRLELNLSIEQVVAGAGFSDAAAFSKACKKEFDQSPSQITLEFLDKYAPLTFEYVASYGNVAKVESETLTALNKMDNICGVTAAQFAEIKRVLEIGAIYGLDDKEAEFVYQLAQECNTTIERAAEFFEDYKLQIENGSFFGERNELDVAKLAFAYDLSFSESMGILHELECHGYDSIATLPKGFFDIYFSAFNEKYGGCDVAYICEILYAMEANDFTADRISEVLDYALILGVDPIELIDNYDFYVEPYRKAILEFGTSSSLGGYEVSCQ